jgi:hypothetical protein
MYVAMHFAAAAQVLLQFRVQGSGFRDQSDCPPAAASTHPGTLKPCTTFRTRSQRNSKLAEVGKTDP